MNIVDVVAHCSNKKYRPKNEKAKGKNQQHFEKTHKKYEYIYSRNYQ